MNGEGEAPAEPNVATLARAWLCPPSGDGGYITQSHYKR